MPEASLPRHATNGPTRDLVAFHWRAGARVALRANAIVGATVVFFYGLEDEAPTRIHAAILELVARRGTWNTRVTLAAICVALAGVAMPRITLGATGWMRSLAVSRTTSRRAAIAALCGTQAFAIVVAILALLGALFVYHARLDAAKVASLPLIIISAAAVVLPVERRAGPALALIALALAAIGAWIPNIIAVAVLVSSDRLSGGIVRLRRKPVHTAPRWSMAASPIAQWIRLTTRTLPVATLIAITFAPAIFVAFGYLIVLHNPDLDREAQMRTVRICGSLAIAVLSTALASSIVRTRPAWPWVRSLPWSSRQRVAGDVTLLGVTMALAVVALVPLDWRSAIVVALLLPPMAAP